MTALQATGMAPGLLERAFSRRSLRLISATSVVDIVPDAVLIKLCAHYANRSGSADPASPSTFFAQWLDDDPNDSARIYANGVGYIARSTDSGALAGHHQLHPCRRSLARLRLERRQRLGYHMEHGHDFSALVTFTSGGTLTQGWGTDARYRTSWSDSISPSFANEISYASLTGDVDTGIKFSVQARPFSRTLTMVFGATSSDYTLRTHLSDNSAADVEISLPQNQVQIATIRYACSVQTGGQLTVYLTKKSATGEVQIASAWVH